VETTPLHWGGILVETLTMYLRRNTKRRMEQTTTVGIWSSWSEPPEVPGSGSLPLGKLPGLDYEERIGLYEIDRILSGRPRTEPSLFKKLEEPPSWAMVNVSGVSVESLPLSGWDGGNFVLCRSLGRREKENAILNHFVIRLEAGIAKLVEQAEKGKLKDRQKVERRIGRLLEQNSRAAALFTVDVTEGSDKKLSIIMRKNEERYHRALDSGGSYILRTNWMESDPKTLWNTYFQLTEVEESFRTEKHDSA